MRLGLSQMCVMLPVGKLHVIGEAGLLAAYAQWCGHEKAKLQANKDPLCMKINTNNLFHTY